MQREVDFAASQGTQEGRTFPLSTLPLHRDYGLGTFEEDENVVFKEDSYVIKLGQS